MNGELSATAMASIKDSVAFAKNLRYHIGAKYLRINSSKWSFMRHFNMIFLAHHLREFRKLSPQTQLEFTDPPSSAAGYFNYFRFHSALHGHNDDLKELRYGPNFIAITQLSISDIQEKSASRGQEVAQTIDEYAGMLVDLLLRGNEARHDSRKVLRFALREIIRNIFEHSQSDDFCLAGQYWPTHGRIQVALSDHGLGIQPTITKNKKLEINNDRDALHFALLPGISGSPNKLHDGNLSDGWRNSGFGLYMTSSFCRKSGGFSIASGECCLVLDDKKTTHEMPYIPGTIIRLDLKENDLQDADATLRRIEQEGERIKATLKNVDFLSASRASRMLNVDALAQETTTKRRAKLLFSQEK